MTSLEHLGYRQELERSLSFRDLVVYGMIFMVPISPFGVFGFVYNDAQGMAPLAYLVGLVGTFFAAMSYASMSRAFPVAGSVYTYVGRGLHEAAGFFAGWLDRLGGRVLCRAHLCPEKAGRHRSVTSRSAT